MRKFTLIFFGIFIVSSLLMYYGDIQEIDTPIESKIINKSQKYFLEERIQQESTNKTTPSKIKNSLDIKHNIANDINSKQELQLERQQLDIEIDRLKGIQYL